MSPLERLYILLIISLPIVRPLNVTFLGRLVPISDLIFAVTMLGWVASVGLGRRAIRRSRFYLLIALYLSALCVSALASEAPPRQSIVKLLGVAYLAGLSVLTINVVRSWAMLRSVMNAWMIGTALTVAGAVAGVLFFYLGTRDPVVNVALSHYGTLPPGNYPRIRSLFANANMMCNYLNVSVMFALIMSQLGWLAPARARVFLAGIWAAALSTLSPGLGGLFLGSGVWTWLRHSSGRTRARWLAAGSLLASVLFLAATFVSPASTRLEPSQRTFIWRTALAIVADHPWLGLGPGMEIFQVEEPTSAGVRQYRKEPHNVWLSIAVQSGLAGVTAFAFLVIDLCRRMRPLDIGPSRTSVVRSGLGLALIGTLLYQGLTGSFEDARHVWVLMGLIVCVSEGLDRDAVEADVRLAA